MPRSPHAYNVHRGSAPPRKVRRWLARSGGDDPRFVTDAMRERHVHPRHLRREKKDANTVSPTAVLADSERASAAVATPSALPDPFARLRGLTR